MSLIKQYEEEVLPKLKEEFNLKNNLELPRLEKIVVNMGLTDALAEKEIIEKASQQLATISGQKPKVTASHAAISNFKLRRGDQIGAMVTLRGKRAWHFLEKLIAIVMPRMRDFRGFSNSKFDKAGNYSLGLSEQIIFPEIDYAKIDKVRGLVITFVVKNSDSDKSKRFLELLGVPFKKS